jgi:WD40 repeat protein
MVLHSGGGALVPKASYGSRLLHVMSPMSQSVRTSRSRNIRIICVCIGRCTSLNWPPLQAAVGSTIRLMFTAGGRRARRVQALGGDRAADAQQVAPSCVARTLEAVPRHQRPSRVRRSAQTLQCLTQQEIFSSRTVPCSRLRAAVVSDVLSSRYTLPRFFQMRLAAERGQVSKSQVVLGRRWVRCLAFDHGNEWFVTGSADRTIKVGSTVLMTSRGSAAGMLDAVSCGR